MVQQIEALPQLPKIATDTETLDTKITATSGGSVVGQAGPAAASSPPLSPSNQSASTQLTKELANDTREEEEEEDPFLVAFSYKDPRDPRQWSNAHKWATFLIYLIPVIWAQCISSLFAPVSDDVAHSLGVSQPAMRTVQAVYLFGFAVGPMVAAPVSEDHGRRWMAIIALFIVSLCQIPCAFANSIGLLIPFRFLAGFFASATFNCVGVVADLWDTTDQEWPVNLYCVISEIGAFLGAVIGGYIHASLGWRWTFGIGGLGMASITAVLFLFAQETREGIILGRVVAQKKKETGDDRYYCVHEKIVQAKTGKMRFTETVGRPLWMLCTEPIVIANAVFDGLNYMVIYAFIIGFGIVYGDTFNWSGGDEQLPLLAAALGSILGFVCLPIQQAWERRCIRRSSDGELVPEERLFWLIVTPLFPIGLFWFAWTAVPGMHWTASIVAVTVVGFVSHIIFYAISDYTVAAYSSFAASAVGAQSLINELLAGSFTLFVSQTYRNLGYSWASSLWGFLSTILAVVPFVMYFYGHKLRERSPFCREQMEHNLAHRKETERLRLKQEAEQERYRLDINPDQSDFQPGAAPATLNVFLEKDVEKDGVGGVK